MPGRLGCSGVLPTEGCLNSPFGEHRELTREARERGDRPLRPELVSAFGESGVWGDRPVLCLWGCPGKCGAQGDVTEGPVCSAWGLEPHSAVGRSWCR